MNASRSSPLVVGAPQETRCSAAGRPPETITSGAPCAEPNAICLPPVTAWLGPTLPTRSGGTGGDYDL